MGFGQIAFTQVSPTRAAGMAVSVTVACAGSPSVAASSGALSRHSYSNRLGPGAPSMLLHSGPVAPAVFGDRQDIPISVQETTAGALIGEPSEVSAASDSETYSVVFTESGLPEGTMWWVNVTNATDSEQSFNSTTTSLTFSEPNGGYSYSLATTDKEFASPGGTFTVDGGIVVETATFSVFTYSVTFTASGLPAGTSWSITVGSQVLHSTTHQIVFSLGNGTYTYHVGLVPGYKTTATDTAFNVTGTPVSLAVKFSVMRYYITFNETGLPSGTKWSVTLTLTSDATSIANSTTSSLRFTEPNGTYDYSIAPEAGYFISAGSNSGSVTVGGASPPNVMTSWTPNPSSGLKLSLLDYVLIAAVVAWVGIAILVIVRRRRRGPPPAPTASVAPAGGDTSSTSPPWAEPGVPPSSKVPPEPETQL